MNELNRRRPEMYQSDICIICLTEKETVRHLASCTEMQSIWRLIEEEVAQEVLKAKEEKEKSPSQHGWIEIQKTLFGKTDAEKHCI